MSSTVKPNVALLPQVVKFLNDSNGRDKLSKFIQDGSRLLAWILLRSDAKNTTGLKFQGLFGMTRDSRKLVQLFRFLNELAMLQDLLKSNSNASSSTQSVEVEQALSVVSRIGWMQYWVCDNMVYLQKAKFTANTTDFNYYAMLGWFVALSTGLILSGRQLSRVQQEVLQAVEKYRIAKSSTSASTPNSDSEVLVAESRKRMVDAMAKRVKLVVNMVGNTADLLVASNGVQLPHRIIGGPFSDGMLGALGCLSASIASYYRWKELNN